MAKIDVYLRSIERFGASGAVLTSGQSVTLKFPSGDRHATQVTPHDQLVGLVREVAPPGALDQIDKNRPATFDVDSNGIRYSLNVQPRPGAWAVAIEPATPTAPAPAAQAPARPAARAATAPVAADDADMTIERGQYDTPGAPVTASGSGLLDQLTHAARSARASDVYLATGAAPAMRAGGELLSMKDRAALDAETISRELGVVAPAAARAAWTEHGTATFTYGDGIGRVRVALGRDQRGPSAAFRLLVGEAPPLDRLGVSREVVAWLDRRGLVLVAGASGSGKTTTLASFVRHLADKPKRVVTLEDPIEIVHTSSWVSQRAIAEHASGIAEGVAAAMREGADAIAIGTVNSTLTAAAVLEAVLAGHLVLATIATTAARTAVEQLVALVPADQRDLARAAFGETLLGVIAPVVKAGNRTFEVVVGSS